MKGVFQLISVALVFTGLTGCGGNISKLVTDDVVYDFDATLQTTPAAPTVGARVNLNLDVVSKSNRTISSDVVLKVVGADGKILYQQTWQEVQFNPGDNYDLTQGFYPDSNAGSEGWNVELTVKDHLKGTQLWDEMIGQLDFNQ